MKYKAQELKKKIRGDDLILGSWITIANSGIAEIMARSGFDWLAVDLEHSVISIHEAGDLIRTIDLCGVSPLVRLSANDPVQIKRVMDAGAHGIIVPMVNSADEARRAVSSVRYPPIGQRGVGLARAQGYGNAFEDYVRWLDDEAIVIVQVEHIEAVENLEKILAVDGVDGFIVGPYDLSGSLGIPGQFDHPKMLDAMQRIKTIGYNSDKAPGIHIVEPDPEQFRLGIDEGYRFIAYSVDIRMLDHECRRGIEAVKEHQ